MYLFETLPLFQPHLELAPYPTPHPPILVLDVMVRHLEQRLRQVVSKLELLECDLGGHGGQDRDIWGGGGWVVTVVGFSRFIYIIIIMIYHGSVMKGNH